jgi:hypothetical protein
MSSSGFASIASPDMEAVSRTPCTFPLRVLHLLCRLTLPFLRSGPRMQWHKQSAVLNNFGNGPEQTNLLIATSVVEEDLDVQDSAPSPSRRIQATLTLLPILSPATSSSASIRITRTSRSCSLAVVLARSDPCTSCSSSEVRLPIPSSTSAVLTFLAVIQATSTKSGICSRSPNSTARSLRSSRMGWKRWRKSWTTCTAQWRRSWTTSRSHRRAR